MAEGSKDPKIRVVVRKRPLNSKERARNENDILETRSPQSVVVKEGKLKVDLTRFIEEHHFTFDNAFDETVTNQELYQATVLPLVSAAFQGTKITCFAYGQTGSGKTFTMMGEERIPGLYLLAANDLFVIKNANFKRHTVWVSFYEIYCGKLFDLLNGRQALFAREDAKQTVNIVGLQRRQVQDVHSLMQIISFGMSMRTVGVTGANDDSSRSHGVLEIDIKDGTKTLGKMSFIDLAGSERGADVTDSDKQTRMDGAEINKSLLALKECIRALDQDKRHTPFRGSKLTQVLKDSFLGNCRTLMIACVSPTGSSCEHTLNTLRYADRVKELKRGGPRSGGDELANELMLPRNAANTVTYVEGSEGYQQVRPRPPQPHPKNTAPQPGPIPSRKAPQKEITPTNLEQLTEIHEKLVATILAEEEELINSHRKQIDDMVELIKSEMGLLHEVDRPGSDVNTYVSELDRVLEMKEEMISSLRNKLRNFHGHLMEEEQMSREFYSAQSEAMDVFDLDHNDEDLLEEVL